MVKARVDGLFDAGQGKSRSRHRCGTCESCLKPDCGKCHECVRKKKFGGDGSSKQACIQRRCNHLQQRDVTSGRSVRAHSSRESVGSYNSRSGERSVKTSTRDFRSKVTASLPAAPPSLLEGSPPKRQRLVSPRRRADVLLSPPHVYGLPVPGKMLGVCGKCGKDGEESNETILLCDGDGCGQEFHLKCCSPPIQDVPEGAFFCFDCSSEGSTESLRKYLREHEQRKDNMKGTSSTIDTILEEDVEDEHPIQGEGGVVPRSELEWTHKNNPQNLIGKPVRLYCPHGNHYHNGRILDVRAAVGDTACLVRFPAGKDYRKTTMTTWLHLEEHCLAVATEVLWGRFGGDEKGRSSKGNPAKWMRAKLWSRTARELIPVMQQLNPKIGQLRLRTLHLDGSPVAPTKPEWGLVEQFGTDLYELLNLPLETRSDDNPPPVQKADRELSIMISLAEVELEEQRRARNWNKLPLVNSMHPQALRVRDEAALGSLTVSTQQEQLIEPSPLVQQGVDRPYMIEIMSKMLDLRPTKDMAASITCSVVDSMPAMTRAATLQERRDSQ